jgi:glycosyltransferase involved in cell wall biosynthesis
VASPKLVPKGSGLCPLPLILRWLSRNRTHVVANLGIVTRKLRSALWHAQHGLQRLRQASSEARRNKRADQWLKTLNDKCPEVLVGANFVQLGGTRMHMHAICRHSSLNTRLFPDESVMQRFYAGEIVERFTGRINELRCSGLKVAHSHVFPFFIEWSRSARKKHGIRWIHTHHNWYYPEFGRNGLEPWQEQFNEGFLLAAAEADVCLCVSRGQQKFLRDRFGLKTHYLANGVDVAACKAGSAARWHASTGISPGFVLFVGRNDPVKHPEFFVQLSAAIPAERFVIAGEGISREVIETEWNLRVPDNLSILGTLSHAEVQDAIAACKVLVLCSRREGLPTLVLEGMVAGKPVVVPDEQGCMEAIGEGQFGFIYQQGNLGDCLEKVLAAHCDRHKPQLAQQHALITYAWPEIMRRLDSIYRGNSPDTVLKAH